MAHKTLRMDVHYGGYYSIKNVHYPIMRIMVTGTGGDLGVALYKTKYSQVDSIEAFADMPCEYRGMSVTSLLDLNLHPIYIGSIPLQPADLQRYEPDLSAPWVTKEEVESSRLQLQKILSYSQSDTSIKLFVEEKAYAMYEYVSHDPGPGVILL